MRFRALRTLGVSFLLALLAGTATMADAATRSTTRSAKTGVSSAKKSTANAGPRKGRPRRRARRAPPPGGDYARNAILCDPATG